MQSVSRTQLPADVLELCQRLDDAGYRAWVVGGCLRDLLRGEPVSDWDLATDARPEEMTRVFKRIVPTGKAHGTMTVLMGGNAYEVTTLRADHGYSDGRRPDSVSFVRNIEDDLARRDFTVNAVAFECKTQTLIDPFDGLGDLRRKLLRAVGTPLDRFREDGLRILRGARFVATLEFELEAATESAFSEALDVFAKVSPERVREEWMKTFVARMPSRAFDVMRRTGIMRITFPELLEQVGCEQNKWHAYDVWTHTMRVLDETPADERLRLAALLHDVGKPRTRKWDDEKQDWTFYQHEYLGADLANNWLRQYKFSNDERDFVVHMIRHHLVAYSQEWSDAAVRRFVQRVGTESVAPLLQLARADARGKGRPVSEELKLLDELETRIATLQQAGVALSTRELAIDGSKVIPLLKGGAGPAVGEILRRLLEHVLDDPQKNTPDTLLALAREMSAEVEAQFPAKH